MIICFDFDGVIREGDQGIYHLGYNCSNKNVGPKAVYLQSAASCRPLLNPLDFALPDDVIYVLSACTTVAELNEKRAWLQHFYGYKVLFEHVFMGTANDVAKEKIELMESLHVEIYFENNPTIVNLMRKLTDKIKIVHYGSWVQEIKE